MFTDLISDDIVLYDHSCEELLMEPAVVADIIECFDSFIKLLDTLFLSLNVFSNLMVTANQLQDIKKTLIF